MENLSETLYGSKSELRRFSHQPRDTESGLNGPVENKDVEPTMVINEVAEPSPIKGAKYRQSPISPKLQKHTSQTILKYKKLQPT